MKYYNRQICFQEVPNEVSLSFLITWCKLNCKWCHSPQGWNWNRWIELDLRKEISPYKWLVSCILFLWGEWEEEKLLEQMQIAKEEWLKTCLYTGQEDVSSNIRMNLDYLKTWPYKEENGGLDNPNTNQKMLNLNTGEDITYLFHK